MDVWAFLAQPSTTFEPIDAARSFNTAGWGTLLWVAVIAFVTIVLLATTGLGLIGGGGRVRE